MLMHNPPHPGEIIRDMCIEGSELTVTAAAERLGVTRKTLSALLNKRAGLSPEMALRLAKVFGRSPEAWMNLQMQFDLWRVAQRVDLSALRPIDKAA